MRTWFIPNSDSDHFKFGLWFRAYDKLVIIVRDRVIYLSSFRAGVYRMYVSPDHLINEETCVIILGPRPFRRRSDENRLQTITLLALRSATWRRQYHGLRPVGAMVHVKRK